MIISVLTFVLLIHCTIVASYSNSTLLAEESFLDHSYATIDGNGAINSQQQYPFGHYDSFPLESAPTQTLDIQNGDYKVSAFSYMTPHSEVGLYKSAKALSIPVAQEMLFSGDGKYVPFDRDHNKIYSRYLRRDAYLSDQCHYQDNTVSQNIDPSDVREAMNYANYAVQGYANVIRRQPFARTVTADFLNTATQAKTLEIASQFLLNKICLNKYDAVLMLPKINVRKFLVDYMGTCGMPMADCDPHSPYRTIDASCTNLANPNLGRSFTCHQRLLPPDYADGIEVPRVAHDSSELPNPRLLSTQLLPSIPVSDHKLTSMTMVFGQFVIHDIARTLPFAPDADIMCCDGANHPECLPITPLPHGDFLTKKFNQTCINFVRTMTCNPCSLGPRQHVNQATQAFDMSQLYGLRPNVTLLLRRMNGGMLRSDLDAHKKEILTPLRNQAGCNLPPKQDYHAPRVTCFQSGDEIRANQHPGLQAMHATFHRRHNQHARNLQRVNPHWDDERLFQEARRLNIAEYLKLIYGEYIPAIMGHSLSKHFGLDLAEHGYSNYDPAVASVTIQEFILSAGRFGHSQINDVFRVLKGKDSYSFLLRDAFFEPSIVTYGHIPGLIRGLIVDPTAAVDPFIVPDVHQFLYKIRIEDFGRDLPAFNILRGREHGQPGYVYYLDYCFGFKVKDWDDLTTFIPHDQLSRIRQFYRHWLDIDLFVGGLNERRMGDGVMGPTFACINGIQFFHLKYGDRFYFEHGKQSGSFTPAQLDNIRHVTSLANILCKTAHIGEAQPKVLLLPSPPHNAKIPCEVYPEIDYNLWAERPDSYH